MSSPHTEYGAPPRAARACERCRLTHLKCHNNGCTPCQSCESSGAECRFLPTRKDRARGRRPRRRNTDLGKPLASKSQSSLLTAEIPQHISESLTGNSVAGNSPVSVGIPRSVDLESLYSTELLLQGIDLFFNHFHADILFSLHEPSIRLTAKSGALDPILGVAILVLTARFIPELTSKYGSAAAACDHFAHAIRAKLLLEADKPTLEKLHAMLFLSFHDWGSGKGAKAWITIGACIRSGLLLRTFRKQTPLAPPFNKPLETAEELIVEESRIRAFWSMILMEHFVTSGKHRTHTRYDEHNSIGKPCSEENFLWGNIPKSISDPGLVRESAQLPCGPYSSEKACLVAAVENWNTVNRWISSGGAKQETEPPWNEASQFDHLRAQLQTWEFGLPRKLQYSKGACAIHGVNKQAGPYGFLHLVHYTSVIFLHREYLDFFPDRRKPYTGRLPAQLDTSVSPSASIVNSSYSKTARDIFFSASLHDLFNAAYRISEILDELEACGSLVNTPFVGFAAFTAATINMYLSIFHWVVPDLAPNALQRAEADVRHLKRVLAVWPVAQQWYATTLRLYDHYKLLHMSERTPQTLTGEVALTFNSFDRSLMDYGEIKPAPDDMAAITSAATASRISSHERSVGMTDNEWLVDNDAQFFLPQEIDWSFNAEQDRYWDNITDEFICLMTNIE